MNKVEVQVFNAYSVESKEDENYYKNLGIEHYNLFDYHNQIIKKDGTVKPNSYSSKTLKPMKPLPQNLETKIRYELDECERLTYSMLKSTTKKAQDLYDSCKRKEDKYKQMLLSSINSKENLYDGEHWDCQLSPLGHCVYRFDGNDYECIFCGEPEERK